MPLSSGDKLGPYEIGVMIGKGGMGEVYRARDPRLGRDVAIKVSAEHFTERFDREARAIASLNHPNICTLHDIGPNYLVMELVEGESPRGPLPLETALHYARQIAAALEEAHGKGVIHRDLKPGNIKVKPDGTIKVLDFGLAKVAPASNDSPRSEDSPTMSMAATQAGMILGTAAYMAPEQAKGKVVDKRADIWAFGVVLYEMLTGTRPFKGDDISEILAGVIKENPDLSEVPAQVRPLLERCLEKDPAKRLRDIGDMELLLGGGLEPARSFSSAQRWLWPAAAAVLAVFAVVALWAPWRKPAVPPELVRFEIFAPEKTTMQKFVVSPDGRKIAFYADGPDGTSALYVRSLDSTESKRIAENGVGDPPLFFWSPDSQSIAFPGGDGLTKLMRVDLSGGLPRVITESANIIAGGSWSKDGTILFGDVSSGVWRVSAAGGAPTPVTSLDESRQEQSHFSPVFLPDGKHFLYLRLSGVAENTGIFVGSVDLKPDQQSLKRLVATNLSPVYVQSDKADTGYLLFLRDDTLLAQSLDLGKLELTGEPARIADHLGNAFEFGYFGASQNGVLAYRSGGNSGFNVLQLSWFDRQGTNHGAATPAGIYYTPALSADSNRVAMGRGKTMSVDGDIWLLEFARKTFTRLTSDPGKEVDPVWSPDGSHIAYKSMRVAGGGIFQRASNGSGGEELVLPANIPVRLDDWSSDGRFLLFSDLKPKTKIDLFVLPMTGDRKPSVYLNSEFNESDGKFSPDGHWVAYVSDESGIPEVYIQPFPLTAGGVGKWTVSNGGGSLPRWRHDGKEIFFVTKTAVMSADVTYSPALKTSIPKQLFPAPIQDVVDFSWDASGDGKKFLLVTAPPHDSGPQSPLTVVLNWTALLKK